jgi:O-methyltransferase
MYKQKYIDLLKMVLIDLHHVQYGEYKPLHDTGGWKIKPFRFINSIIQPWNLAICRIIAPDLQQRIEGRDWPTYADTMIGLKRIENLEFCINTILQERIPGDIIETGVWRGGASIFMKALLDVNEVRDRTVWLADSFEGLPKPNEKEYSSDKGDKFYNMKELAISIDTVKENFSKYGLLDENVKFLKGWFKDTLPVAPLGQLALIRLDGDMYESTMDGIVNLYPKLAKGGFVIVDDWGSVKGCQEAILDYRKKHNIQEEIIPIDWAGVYWRKEN